MVGVSGYAIQNWFIKKRERDTQLKVLKISLYEKLIYKLVEGLHIVRVEGLLTSLEYKKELNILMNALYLYGSKEAIKAADNLMDNPEQKDVLRLLIITLVNEIRDNKLEESEVGLYLSS